MLGFPFGRRALPVSMQEKNARGKTPRASRTGQDRAIPTYRRCPTPLPVDGDRLIAIGRDKSGHSCPTVVRENPLPNRSRSGDLDLQRYGQDPEIRPYRLQSSVDGDRLIAIGTRAGTLVLQRDRSGSGDPDLQT